VARRISVRLRSARLRSEAWASSLDLMKESIGILVPLGGCDARRRGVGDRTKSSSAGGLVPIVRTRGDGSGAASVRGSGAPI